MFLSCLETCLAYYFICFFEIFALAFDVLLVSVRFPGWPKSIFFWYWSLILHQLRFLKFTPHICLYPWGPSYSSKPRDLATCSCKHNFQALNIFLWISLSWWSALLCDLLGHCSFFCCNLDLYDCCAPHPVDVALSPWASIPVSLDAANTASHILTLM